VTLTDDRASTRAVGIDDGPFTKQQETAPLVAALLAGPHLERVHTGRITVDGLDATDKAVKLLRRWKPAPILLSGVTFGGFNLIDPRVLQRTFRIPVIVVVGYLPDNRAVKRALIKHFSDWKQRWRIISSLGPLRQSRTNPDEPPIYYEAFGTGPREAAELLKATSYISRIPEPLRVAGLLARGLFPLSDVSTASF
jgi:uncharacterized protein